MANYSTLKAAVADVVKTNGTQAITGANLQAVLLSIINSVGGGGYIFKGVATPSTSAGTPDENVFYLGGAGTYANFGTSVTVPAGSIGVFKYNGSWTKEQIALFAGIDDVPTAGSDNLVKSGGVAGKVNQIEQEVDDLENEKVSAIVATKDDFTLVDNVYRTANGVYAGSVNWHEFRIENQDGFYRVLVRATGGDVTNAAIIAFYNETWAGASSFMSAVTAVVGQTDYSAIIPSGCKLIIVSNRKSVMASPSINIVANDDNIFGRISTLESNVAQNTSALDSLEPLLIKWERGGIDDSGVDTSAGDRLRSNYIRGNVAILAKTGYSITNIYKYSADGTFVGKEYPANSALRREAFVDYTGLVRIVMQKTDSTSIYTTDDFLRDVYYLGSDATLFKDVQSLNRSAARPVFYQGGILSDGTLYNDSTRIYSDFFKGNFRISLKSGYVLSVIVSYYNDETKRVALTPSVTSAAYSVDTNNNYLCRISIRREDNAAITPEDDFLDEFVGGADYVVAEHGKRAVNAPYRYEGEDGSIPSTPEDVYSVYDSFVDSYPQFASREVLGTTRRPVTFTIDNINLLPITISISAALNVGDILYVGGDLTKAVKVIGYYNDIYGGKKYGHIKAQSNFSLGTSGSLTDSGGNTIATFSSPEYGRCVIYLNSDTTNLLNLSLVEPATGNCVACYSTTTGSPSASGTIYDADGNALGSYTGLAVGNGESIYCYTFDFSSKNRGIESSLSNNIFVLGGVHGYEPKAIYGHMMFFNELFNNWKNSEVLSMIRGAARFTVIPVANPWGLRHSKNSNVRGVDINRNFPNNFPDSPEYYFRWSGDSALSEPEAIAISQKLALVKPFTDIMVDFHNEGGFFANMFITPSLSNKFANAVSRAITEYGQMEYDIPAYLFAWKNGSSTRYTDTPAPQIGARVFTNSSTLSSDVVSAIGSGTITISGVTYTRSSGADVDYTNFCSATSYALGGMAAGYASSIGINQSSVSEVADGYFLTAEQKRKMQVEVTGNYIYALIMYFFY